jgi:hypothetical protein
MNTTTETQLQFDFMQPSQSTINLDVNIYFSTDIASIVEPLTSSYEI